MAVLDVLEAKLLLDGISNLGLSTSHLFFDSMLRKLLR